MLTPQDIQDVKFDRSMKGYDRAQVEEFLDAVQSDYTALYKENATLKGKMRVLVDKIEEYRQVDEQMRKAFFNAQVSAQEIIARAQTEADQILHNARSQADSRVNDIHAQVIEEEQRLAAAKEACRQYAARIRQMMEDDIRVIGEHMDRIDALMACPANQLPRQETAPEAAGESALREEAQTPAGQPGDTIDLGDAPDFSAASAQGIRDGSADDADRIRFTDLRFGKDYKDYEED